MQSAYLIFDLTKVLLKVWKDTQDDGA